MEPLISVLIPVYNRADLIIETLESVRNQTYKTLEVVIVDDGSTDNTAEVIKNYAMMHPDITLRYEFQKNSGPGAALNRAVSFAKGEIVAFLDSDDIWLPNKLEKQVAEFKRDPKIDFSVCAFQAFDSDSRAPLNCTNLVLRLPEVKDPLEVFLFGSTNMSGVLVSINIVQNVRFQESFRLGYDWAFLLECAVKGYSYSCIVERLTLFRVHTKNLSSSNVIGSADEAINIFRYILSILPVDFPRERRRFIKRRFHFFVKQAFYIRGIDAMKQGNSVVGRRFFLKSIWIGRQFIAGFVKPIVLFFATFFPSLFFVIKPSLDDQQQITWKG